jgi:uncharacterized protein (TIGR03066 family)
VCEALEEKPVRKEKMAAEDSLVYHDSASTPEAVEASAALARARQDMTFSILCERNLLMRHLGFIATGFLVLCLAACSGKKEDKKDGKDDGKKDDKKEATNAEKLLGKWEVTKSGAGMPVGTTLEFAKDGKLTITVKGQKAIEGSYKLDGDTILNGPKGKPDEGDKNKIKSLTDTKLVTEDDKGKIDEFTKK